MNKVINEFTPMPERLSTWNNSNEMIYKCPKCRSSFQYYGDKQNFCHICGQQLNWEGSPRYVSDEFKNNYWELYHKCYCSKFSKEERQQATTKFDELMNDFYFGKVT